MESLLGKVFHPHAQEWKTFLSIESGDRWRQDLKCGGGCVQKTCFGVTGFTQPHFITQSMNRQESRDGLLDRFLLTAPTAVLILSEALRAEAPDFVQRLGAVYKVSYQSVCDGKPLVYLPCTRLVSVCDGKPCTI